MKILLTGASGYLGQAILKKLLEAGYTVRACSRHPQKWQKLYPQAQWIYTHYQNYQHADNWHSALENIDIVINTVGIIKETKQQSFEDIHIKAPTALFQACQERGLDKIIHISALGADDKATTKYHISKRQADTILKELIPKAVILQPSIIIGEEGKSTELFAALAQLPIIPLIGQGKQLLQPISIDDFLKTILAILKTWPDTEEPIPVVGQEIISFKELLLSLRQWQGLKSGITLSIPLFFIYIIAKINNLLGIGLLNSSTLSMLERGNTAEVNQLTESTGIQPASIKQYLEKNPATQAKRWYLGLYFIKPLLWLTISFIWIWTAIVSAFFYPEEKSYQLLAATGITGWLAPFALYGSALLDALLGFALLFRIQVTTIILLQISLILGYTIIISFSLPELWLHPFGPVSKNLPLILASLSLLIMEKR